MYFGTYERSLDSKKRLQIPSKLVNEMPKSFYLLRGFEGAISIYNEDSFKKMIESLSKLPYLEKDARAYVRLASSSVFVLDVDSHGRITIGSELAERYAIGDQVTIIGVIDHFEIWDKARYQAYLSDNGGKLEEIAENLSGYPGTGC